MLLPPLGYRGDEREIVAFYRAVGAVAGLPLMAYNNPEASGTDMGPAVKGLPGDACQCPHWGYMLKGRLRMRSDDGERVYEAGQAYYWAPGHVPVALEDCEFVEFSPTEEFQKVIDHVKAQAG